MNNSLKKLLCGLCALVVSVSMLSCAAFADEIAEGGAEAGNTAEQGILPETQTIFDMINNPSTSNEDFEFFASTYMAQNILGDVVYQLMEKTDADRNSYFFTIAAELLDAPTADILGVDENTEDAVPETVLLSSKAIKHTYELDKAAGITAEDADPDTYGEATTVVQNFKGGTDTVSKIVWNFALPNSDTEQKIEFTVSAVPEGEGVDEAAAIFELPNITVNGEFSIGIVLNNWVPEGDEREIEDPDFVTTAIEYVSARDEVGAVEEQKEPAEDTTFEDGVAEAGGAADAEPAETDADGETAEAAADAE